MSNAKIIWDYLKSQGLNDFGAAGLMGNLYAESGLVPYNLENKYNELLGLSDEQYTAAVDNGSYVNFVYDKAGYGLAQWTWWSRKKELYDYAKSLEKSIGDLNMQLEFLAKELNNGYRSVLDSLKNATSVFEASNKVLFDFERPANMGIEVQNKRAEYGQVYYDKYADSQKGASVMSNSPLVDYTIISPNRISPRDHEIDTVTIHCVVGQCTVEGLGDTFASPSREASSNYGIGKDGKIGMYVEEKDRSWCSGGYDKYGIPIRVNGISGADNDNRAITIEVASDPYDPYAVNDAAYESLIKLLVDICQRNPNIKRLRWQGDKSLVGQVDKQNMTVHRWFAYKSCPGDYLYNRHGEIAAEVNRRLDELENVEDDDMTQEKFNEMMNAYLKGLQDNDCGQWSAEGRDYVVDKGLFVGNGTTVNGEPNYMWGSFMTREQLAVVLQRFAEMNGLK